MNRQAHTQAIYVPHKKLSAIMLLLGALLGGCMPLSPVALPVQLGADALRTSANAEAQPAEDQNEAIAAVAVESNRVDENDRGNAIQTALDEAAPAETDLPSDETGMEAEPDAIGALIDVEFQQVRFTYDTTIARNWTVEYISNISSADIPPSFYTGPMRMAFGFGSYSAPLREVEPVIYVYRIADIASTNEYKVANLLGALLASDTPLQNHQTLPFLPRLDQEQSIVSQPQYMQFQSGSGIRYLTIMEEANEPFRSDSVWYTFQGLTSDNKFYIAAVFPLAADMFASELGDDYSQTAFESRRGEYLLLSKAALNLAPRAAFTPRLSRLDALVESIQIDDSVQ